MCDVMPAPTPSTHTTNTHDTKPNNNTNTTPKPIYSPNPQIIDGQFLDQKKLMGLLKDIYGTSPEGKNNFRVELRLNRYRIYPPVRSNSNLTEAQIDDCRCIRRR